MANVKARLKAPKSAPTKKGCGTKKSLRGAKEAVDATVRNETNSSVVKKRRSNLKILTSDEKVQYSLKHGHLFAKFAIAVKPRLKSSLKDKFTIKSPFKARRKKKVTEDIIQTEEEGCTTNADGFVLFNKASTDPPLSRTKSGRIKKKNKDSLKLIDNILKSELMILDSSAENKPETTQLVPSGVNNNNNSDTTDQNNIMIEFNVPGNTNEYGNNEIIPGNIIQIGKSNIANASTKNAKAKQVTLSNGVVLTLSGFECDFCQKVFNRKSSIRRHMYVHLGMKPYACTCCKKKYRKRSNLESHVARKHTHTPENPKYYVCRVCDKPFLLKENMSLHMIGHVKNENSFKCMYCNKKFSYHLLLLQHEKQHLVTGRYQCTLCTKSYECRDLLYLHVKGHLKIKDYICQYCGKEFLRQNSMRRHVEICHGGHRVQCPICKKKLKGHLTEHMRTHDNKRPHVCPECGQRFTQSTQLTVHRRSHTGARPYPCRICDRPFTHSNALMLHIRRHTGEKPFACAMCPLSFSQLPHMKSHMRKIHGKENPYKCPKCHQFFKLKAQLESHTKTCTVGDVEKTFEEKLNDSVKGDGDEIESVMSLSRMRFLLALLLTKIASKEKLKYLGFNKRLIDELLIESLEAMGQTPCKDDTLSPLMRLKTNIEMLMDGTVPKDQMEKFRSEKKTTEELLELLTSEK